MEQAYSFISRNILPNAQVRITTACLSVTVSSEKCNAKKKAAGLAVSSDNLTRALPGSNQNILYAAEFTFGSRILKRYSRDLKPIATNEDYFIQDICKGTGFVLKVRCLVNEKHRPATLHCCPHTYLLLTITFVSALESQQREKVKGFCITMKCF
jgi:hypothetical protein